MESRLAIPHRTVVLWGPFSGSMSSPTPSTKHQTLQLFIPILLCTYLYLHIYVSRTISKYPHSPENLNPRPLNSLDAKPVERRHLSEGSCCQGSNPVVERGGLVQELGFMGFRDWGTGFRVQGVGFKVQGLGYGACR